MSKKSSLLSLSLDIEEETITKESWKQKHIEDIKKKNVQITELEEKIRNICQLLI